MTTGNHTKESIDVTEPTRALALTPLAQSDWQIMRQQGELLVRTGFLPNSIKTPEQAVAIIMKGRELHIPPMYSLSNIVIVQGKPTCSAELMLALVYRDHGDDALRIVESTAERCEISYKRRAWAERATYAFTLADARTAQLVGKGGPWTQYPAAMLRARCISAVARMGFPDSIAGMYTPEELGVAVTASPDGDIQIAAEAPHAVVVPPRPTVVVSAPTPADDGEDDIPLFDPPERSSSPLWADVDKALAFLTDRNITIAAPPPQADEAYLKNWIAEARAKARKEK